MLAWFSQCVANGRAVTESSVGKSGRSFLGSGKVFMLFKSQWLFIGG